MASSKAYVSVLFVVFLAVLMLPYGATQDYVCMGDYSTCAANATCTNATMDGDATETFNCTCETGFEYNGAACEMQDPCDFMNPCSTNATCNDTGGMITCMCNDGFTGDGMTCENLNECELAGSPCDKNAMCEDMMGTFNCTCNPGFMGDGLTCQDIDECALLMNGGMAMMTTMSTMMMENMTTDMMTTMMETTTADMMGDNMTTTTEMPEMMMEIVPCDDKATCMNTPGGYTCQCPRAYVGNGFSCRLNLLPIILAAIFLLLLIAVLICCCIGCSRRRAMLLARRNPLLEKPRGFITPTNMIVRPQPQPQRIIVYRGMGYGGVRVPVTQVAPPVSQVRPAGIYSGAAYGVNVGGYQWTAQ